MAASLPSTPSLAPPFGAVDLTAIRPPFSRMYICTYLAVHPAGKDHRAVGPVAHRAHALVEHELLDRERVALEPIVVRLLARRAQPIPDTRPVAQERELGVLAATQGGKRGRGSRLRGGVGEPDFHRVQHVGIVGRVGGSVSPVGRERGIEVVVGVVRHRDEVRLGDVDGGDRHRVLFLAEAAAEEYLQADFRRLDRDLRSASGK